MQALKKPGDGPGFKQEEVEIKIKPFKPDFDIHETLKMTGASDVSEAEKQEAARDAARRNRQTRVLCCCRVPGCGIGPFTEIEEY